jgi:glycosyltransferase involved in cell wall biosynthesis
MTERDLDSFASTQPIKLLTVIVAAYDESKTIAQSLRGLFAVLGTLSCASEILVIESNSKDNTRFILKQIEGELGLRIMYQNYPEGKGSAIRLGMTHMRGDVFLIYDADAEYDPQDIPKLLEPIESGKTSFVLGTRHKKGSPMRVMSGHRIRPKVMNMVHDFFTSILNLTFGTNMTDPFTMYKVFRADVFLEAELKSKRFDLDWELVCKALRIGCVPIEIPVYYKSRSFAEGKKVRFFRDPLTWIAAYIKYGILSL